MQRSAHFQFAVFPKQIDDLCHTVLKEMGLHAGCTDTSDLLFVYQKTYAGMLWLFNLKHCHKRRISTHSVVMSVSHDHAAVKAVISGSPCRDNFNLRRQKIFLVHTVLFGQNI